MGRHKFSLAEEKKIIDFVKNNEIIYNVRHANYRDSETKNRLWMNLAGELNAEVDAVKKKWTHMRDYFVRNQTKKSTGKLAVSTKREESMMFLLDTSILKRSTATNMRCMRESILVETSPDAPQSELIKLNQNVDDSFDGYAADETDLIKLELMMDESQDIEHATPSTSRSSTSMATTTTDGRQAKKRVKPTDPTDALCELLAKRRALNLIDLLPPPVVKDKLDYFFESIVSTMRTFPELTIAKLKLQISQLVGQEEIALAESQTTISVSNASPISFDLKTINSP